VAWAGVLLSLLAGLATGIGGLFVALLGGVTHRMSDSLLGFSAGVMVAIATLSLIPEALRTGGLRLTLAGLACGTLLLWALDRYLRERPLVTPDAEAATGNLLRQGWLVFWALTLHNLPEGLTVGASYGATPRLGLFLALAIALHNIPEGVAVATPFRMAGVSWRRSVWYATVSGLSEPLAALVGVIFVRAALAAAPFALGFAAGAMLYVTSDELIPESHSHGYQTEATLAFASGFALFLILAQFV